jgi:hypothetical protein
VRGEIQRRHEALNEPVVAGGLVEGAGQGVQQWFVTRMREDVKKIVQEM